MRRIYDGELRKEFGTGSSVAWKGRITFIAAVTEEIDRYYGFNQSLGERFIYFRWSRAGGQNHGDDAALVAMNQDRKAVEAEVQAAAQALLSDLPNCDPTGDEIFQRRIAALAEFVAHARTHIPRDNQKHVELVPQPESATRLSQQLWQLAKGSALLDRRDTVNETDFAIAQRGAFDSIPANKRVLLEAVIRSGSPNDSGLRRTTWHYAGEDLELMRLFARREDKSYFLSDFAKATLDKAGIKHA
jgi:hypothetical protein